MRNKISVRALKTKQDNVPVYSFYVDSKDILKIADNLRERILNA